MNTIVITGASSGLGEGYARVFAKLGHPLVLVARRMDRLEQLRDSLLLCNVDIQLVQADLATREGVQSVARACRQLPIEGLINNAGLGFQQDFARMTAEQMSSTLHVNAVALTELCHEFLPRMIQQKHGFILNVASTAGFQPLPHFGLYAATKSYVIRLSEALYEENRKHGVLVCCVCPGPVHTEFQEKAGMSPRFFARAQSVDEVIAASLRGLRKKKALVWTSLFQRFFSLCSDLSPNSIRRWVAARVLELCGAGKS